jgi:hypothetical protein
MLSAFTENFKGTYKRPHNIGDLQRCRRADDETSQTFLARWLDMKNSYEGVTYESAILAFIDSLERGLMRYGVDSFSPSSWEPQEEGMMNIAARFSLSKRPRYVGQERKEPIRLKVMPASCVML